MVNFYVNYLIISFCDALTCVSLFVYHLKRNYIILVLKSNR